MKPLPLVLALATVAPACGGPGGAPDPADVGDSNERPPPGPVVDVRVERTDTGWQLLRGGEPYLVRGAAGSQHLDALVAAGGNSLRTWGVDEEQTRDLLDAAHARGLTVTVGLWLGHPEHGFDYRNEEAVRQQRETLRRQVMSLRDHPALLLWGVGNEVELGTDDPLVWEAINDIAQMVHALDPHHPTMAVTAEIGEAHERHLRESMPAIDIWGINSYGGIASLPERLDERGYDGPWLATEMGHAGTWESATTAWGAPLEPASAAKAEALLDGWRGAVESDRDRCFGGYVFYWASAEHPTDTWYPMFTPEGQPLAQVDAVTRLWTGDWPANRAPEVTGLTSTAAGGYLAPGATFDAALAVVDPEGHPLRVSWLLAPDAHAPAWDAAERCEPLDGAAGTEVTLAAPSQPGAWRLVAFARDPGGRAGFASLSFYVEAPESAGDVDAYLPMHVDDHYAPSGWMGDAGGLSASECTHPGGVCGGPCHRFTWEPGAEGWVGVLWQHPANNWGDEPGLRVEPGATELRFVAWAEEPGATVNFAVGSRVETGPLELATEPTTITVALDDFAYAELTTAFGWTMGAGENPDGATFSVTDVVWVREAGARQ